ncbi:ATP-grasp domain-containing protein [Nonomuraea sp. NN258]|uniref:ATP-grasp domain-containing protein n=1 Tax=Nonomuraea antri TaxID=2730852 RepID=UPI00156A114A|nr:ATP-grasp domain-containing protein [Nonomuraea antri]NRQ38257.1 ATP-grasp domain-containing protein [Nonomuraea antri]
MTMGLLMCADPLRPGRVDPHFAAEAAALRELGGAPALIDHDALLAGRVAEAVSRVPEGFGPAWYRGWMVGVERYRELESALAARGCRLATEAPAYRTAHELPGWLATLGGLTPRSAVVPMSPGEPAPDANRLRRLTGGLRPGAYVVKDYVKSRKHEWAQACYAPDLAALERVTARFLDLQGEDLTGGLVIREYERLRGPQLRIWWLDGEPFYTGPHPDEPHEPDESAEPGKPGEPVEPGDPIGPGVPIEPVEPVEPGDPIGPPRKLAAIRSRVRALRARFVTTDLMRRHDGAWRVVEVGDGQVSDWPRHADPAILMRALRTAGYGLQIHKGFSGPDAWDSATDIGASFDGVTLTGQRFDEVVTAYAIAVDLLVKAAGVTRLALRDPYGECVAAPAARVPELVRALMTEDRWYRLDDGAGFTVTPFDLVLHVTTPVPPGETAERIRALGLEAWDEPPLRHDD